MIQRDQQFLELNFSENHSSLQQSIDVVGKDLMAISDKCSN